MLPGLVPLGHWRNDHTFSPGPGAEAKVSELGSLIKAGAVGSGIHTEKAKLRRGRPTEIRRTENLAELMREAQRKCPTIFRFDHILEGTAEQVGARLENEPDPATQ